MKTPKLVLTNPAIAEKRCGSLTSRLAETLGWSQLQYCTHQYDHFEGFAAHYSEMRHISIDRLRFSPAFRKLWNREWLIRNVREFIPFAVHFNPGDGELIDEYLFINHHLRLINDSGCLARFDEMIAAILNDHDCAR
jgi:hypothetical protein